MSTYTGTITTGIYLGSVGQNPLTVAAGGYVSNSFGDAIYGSSAVAWNLTNFGIIKTTGGNGSGIDLRAGGTVTNAATASISGVAGGVGIFGGAGTIINSGTIRGTGTGGLGVYLQDGGAIVNGATNATSALVAAGNDGVRISGAAGTIANFATIQGIGTLSDGVLLAAAGTLSNDSGGIILGQRSGTELGANATKVSNSGRILGAGYGVYIGTAVTAGVVANLGTIASTATSTALYQYAAGILIDGSGTVVNGAATLNSALISGFYIGAAIGGSDDTVMNYGTIAGTGSDSVGIHLSGRGLVVNSAGGMIVGGVNGAEIDSTGTILNYGTLDGTSPGSVYYGSAGVALEAGGSVVNNANGLITGVLNGVYMGAGGSVANSGTISGTGAGGGGILLADYGSVANASGGLITGVYTGLLIDFNGTVTNSGTIAAPGTLGDGVFLYAFGYVANVKTAVITGAYVGVEIEHVGGTVTNSGTIVGGDKGVYLKEGGVVVNNAAGYIAATATNGYGIKLGAYLAGGYVRNFGTVVAGPNGTGIKLASGVVTNYGSIIAPSATAVYVRHGTFINHGLVEGRVSGIELSLATGTAGNGNVTVAGTVIGATGISVDPANTAGQTATVGGTVIGTSGTAVALAGGSNRLIVDPGAVFTGMLDGGGGRSVLEIAASGSGSGAAGVLGADNAIAYVSLGSVVNFSALQVDPSATLDSSGVLSFDTLVNQGQVNVASGDSLALGDVAIATNTGIIDLRTGAMIDFEGPVANQILEFNPAGGTAAIDQPAGFGGTITDFAAADTIDLALGTATDPQYSGGVLSLSYDGVAIELSVATAYVVPQFLLAGDNDGGTDITVEEAPPPAVTEALVDDTGSSNTDKVTSNPTVGGSGDAKLVVTITEGGNTLGTATANSSGAWSFTPTGLADGVHTLVASETDANGDTGTASLTFTLKTSAPAPAALALSPASDSGVPGDDITNVTDPVITGTGEAGDTVTLDDGSIAIGSATVASDGAWAITPTNALASGTHSLTATEIDVAGNVSAASSALSLEIDTTPPAIADAAPLTVAGNSGATAIGIPAPTDALALTVTVTGLPTDGSVLLSDGSTAVSSGQTLSIAQLTGLEFQPTANLFGQSGTFTYSATDAAGNTAFGSATLAIQDQSACYCRGTLILTERGEVPVEGLAIGDKVVTISGEAKPIRWIGWRSYHGRFVAGNRAVLPIRIGVGAIAEGLPRRDLFVSPEHALYIGGLLVPARLLVNGASVVQVEAVAQVDYFHIELATHEIVFAEGMPAETFVDCDNRGMFQNADEFTRLYPGDRRRAWNFSAPRLDAGSPELLAIRVALLGRAEALGHALTDDPDLHLIVDGEIVRPDPVGACRYRFDIRAGSTAIWLASRSTVPAEIVVASLDIRRLGVPVEHIVLNDGDLSIEAWHGHAGLSEGYHEDEATHRWTVGLARLPESWLRSFPGGATLDVHLVPTDLRYRAPPPSRSIAAA